MSDNNQCADENDLIIINNNENNIFGNNSIKFLKERGNTLYRQGLYNEAIDCYTKALDRLDYSNDDILRAQLLCNRAACYQLLNDWRSSLSDCDDAILFDDSYPKAYIRRSIAFENLKLYKKSLSDLTKAIELDPELSNKYESKKNYLKKLADIEFEREKTEAFDYIKNVGKKVLNKFGLSYDNFKVQRNEESGSYNIQFQQ